MTNRQIGEYFGGLSYSAVAKVQERLLAKAGKDTKVMNTINTISNKMSNVKGCPHSQPPATKNKITIPMITLFLFTASSFLFNGGSF